MIDITQINVGDKIKFERETHRYTVRAKGKRYLVCTKPFNARRTVLYTVVDSIKNIRGTENLTFSMGAETTQECEEMIARLEATENPTEVSRRNSVDLKIEGITKGK